MQNLASLYIMNFNTPRHVNNASFRQRIGKKCDS